MSRTTGPSRMCPRVKIRGDEPGEKNGHLFSVYLVQYHTFILFLYLRLMACREHMLIQSCSCTSQECHVLIQRLGAIRFTLPCLVCPGDDTSTHQWAGTEPANILVTPPKLGSQPPHQVSPPLRDNRGAIQRDRPRLPRLGSQRSGDIPSPYPTTTRNIVAAAHRSPNIRHV
jgi:hypothetical protein